MSRLDGKTCLITGGAGSIGMATAERFLAEGARVLLADRDQSALDAAVRTLGTDRAAGHRTDVTVEDDVAACVAAVLDRWGRLDVAIANAGVTGPIEPVTEYPADEFDTVLAVHVRGAFLVCKHALRHMDAGGSIIIASSVAALRGDPGVSGYITAKHAQVGLMRSVAKEAAPRGIRVNTIHPGPVDNDFQAGLEKRLGQVIGADATAFFNEQIPLGRHAAAREIAASMLFLASDESSFTTGTTLVADGGMSV
ncbi:SDR family NAD(P)-dependent oxidoreductase [Actinomadura sp. 9N215]|uniref:SDR family NAD(P)-dependent oxidoreductase n=1 Tax=Actinomadura sp. 9N215 TaxID=3375150 RepID=UPI0037A9B57B